MHMRALFYDDELGSQPIRASLFLAGPTSRGVRRTGWRAFALDWLERHRFEGTVLVPEFRDGLFEEMAPRVLGKAQSPVPGMRAVSHEVLTWETAGIEQSTVVVFWMPFCLAREDDPASLPGFTTRAEVARETARDASRIVLGMPEGAL